MTEAAALVGIGLLGVVTLLVLLMLVNLAVEEWLLTREDRRADKSWRREDRRL